MGLCLTQQVHFSISVFLWFPVSPRDKECCIECLVSLSLSFRNRIKEYLKILLIQIRHLMYHQIVF